MNATVYIATSLDGFIAREDGAIDWLLAAGAPDPDGEDYGYGDFFQSVDALVMGRNSYEMVRTFDSWPYGTKPVVVLTSRPLDLPAELRGTVESMHARPEEVVRRLSDRGMGHLYVDGGKTVQDFLSAGLIQRVIVTRIPVLIGSGIPLFGPVPADVRLRHVETHSFPNGFVQSEYRIGES